jgi:glycosyltransferase involved in cell wall biosynthesis
VKVCILTSSFPRFKGDSAGVFLYHFCRALVKKGVEIEVITPADHGYSYSENWHGIDVSRFCYFYPTRHQVLCYGAGIPKNISASRLAKVQIPFFVAAEFTYTLLKLLKPRTDVIHAHWSIPQGLTGILCKKFLKIPCVTTIHGTDVFGLRGQLLQTLNAMVINSSDVCTANSRSTARLARNMSKSKNIRVIPMGVDLDLFQRSSEVELLRSHYRRDGRIVLFVGRLIDLKGVDYLIKALPRVIVRFPDVKLLIIGSGPQKDRLVHLTKQLGMERHVSFIGAVSQKDLIKFYSLAHLLVLPSIVNHAGETEGLGVVLIEAMACGLPVIGSDVGGIPDLIKDGETGLLVKQKDPDLLAEKINILLGTSDLKQRLIENGYKMVKENFSWDIIADKFVEIYRDVLKR